jgi:nucleoside-diphosphate-sugar epimerase
MVTTIEELEEWLSRPDDRTIEALKNTPGDILILGAGGKMGPTLARMARRATSDHRKVFAVSRFSSASAKSELESHGVQCIACDLMDPVQLNQLPDAPNVVFMAGQKFGTSDSPEMTWMINAIVPSLVGRRYPHSRIVAFSTGCVYPLVSVSSGGCVESDSLDPPGEYAFSCVARERVFTHFAKTQGNRLLLFRLNYAIDLRYGVLHDIARKVFSDQPIDLSMGHVNVIWQGDANARALQSLSLVDHPPAILNVTGKECLPVRAIAKQFGVHFRKSPKFIGNESESAWLSNASRSFELFGDTNVSIDEMIEAQSVWIAAGGSSLGKPTHFEAVDGRF